MVPNRFKNIMTYLQLCDTLHEVNYLKEKFFRYVIPENIYYNLDLNIELNKEQNRYYSAWEDLGMKNTSDDIPLIIFTIINAQEVEFKDIYNSFLSIFKNWELVNDSEDYERGIHPVLKKKL